MDPSAPFDLLIIGQGLAGTLAAWEALRRGLSVRVVDAGGPAASRVGAGLFTPVTGQRLTLTWRADELLPAARAAYTRLGSELGRTFLRELPTLRLLESETEAERWSRREAFPDLLRHSREPRPGELDPFPVDRGRAVAVIEGSGWVDCATLLDAFRARLAADGRLVEDTFRWADARLDSEAVSWRGMRARRVLFCEGYRGSVNPVLAGLPFRNARGDVLTVRIPGFPETHVVNRGVFALPVGQGRFRVGATFDWQNPEPVPSEAGRAELEGKLRSWLRTPFEVLDHQAGVRPVCVQTWPVAGPVPGQPRACVLTGFGAKGVIYAPTFAAHLLDHLYAGAPLLREVDPARRWT